MANRSKKTVLSVRIEPSAKAALDMLAAIRQESLPVVIEELLSQAFEQQAILAPPFIKKTHVSPSGTIGLGHLMRFIWVDDPELFKLRLHLLEPTALSERDQTVTGTVFKNLDIFRGDDHLFDGKARQMVSDSPAIPKLSLSLVRLYWPLLNEYARFLATNSMNVSFADYVDLLRKSGELDEIYDAI
jgi:hypothetical protein